MPRTTLDLDDDLLLALKRAAVERHEPLTRLANRLLRSALAAPPPVHKPVHVQTFDLGPARLPLDNVAEVLAVAEDEAFR